MLWFWGFLEAKPWPNGFSNNQNFSYFNTTLMYDSLSFMAIYPCPTLSNIIRHPTESLNFFQQATLTRLTCEFTKIERAGVE